MKAMRGRVGSVVWVGTIACAICAAGCSSLSFQNPFAKKVAEPTQLPAREWAALRQENARRLRGEGIPARGGAATRPAESAGGVGGGVNEFFGFVDRVFWQTPKRLIGFARGQTPGLYARMMEDEQSADQRRTGILRLVTDYDFARKEPYTKRFWQIAQGDPDNLVRVAAVRALNRSRDAAVTPVATRYLGDADPLLRLEAAKALANIPDEKAVTALIKHTGPTLELRGESGRMESQPESRDVRVACVDALRNYPTADVARALVETLRDRDFEVSWQARKSLVLLTGHDYRYDQDRWREYLSKAAKPFG